MSGLLLGRGGLFVCCLRDLVVVWAGFGGVVVLGLFCRVVGAVCGVFVFVECLGLVFGGLLFCLVVMWWVGLGLLLLVGAGGGFGLVRCLWLMSLWGGWCVWLLWWFVCGVLFVLLCCCFGGLCDVFVCLWVVWCVCFGGCCVSFWFLAFGWIGIGVVLGGVVWWVFFGGGCVSALVCWFGSVWLLGFFFRCGVGGLCGVVWVCSVVGLSDLVWGAFFVIWCVGWGVVGVVYLFVWVLFWFV